jgi:Ca2+-binding EF-hand superfamily protein
VGNLEWNILESLKTTIDIPAQELADAMRFTGAKTKREAIVRVMQEFNQRQRMAALLKFSGTFSDKFPTNEAIEAADLKCDQEWQH